MRLVGMHAENPASGLHRRFVTGKLSWPARFGLIAACVVAAAVLVSCDAEQEVSATATTLTPEATPAPAGRVLIIGIDGASYRVINPMLSAGRLPNLARIASDGVYGLIRSSGWPLLSPRIWTTVATGKDAVKHGIFGWVRKTADEKLARLNYSFDRESHALWNILSDRGKSVGIVNWLTTYPPAVVRGVIVSSHAFPAEVGGKIFLGTLFAGVDDRKLEPVKRGYDRGPVVFPKDWTDRALNERHAEVSLTPIANPFLADGFAETMQLSEAKLDGFYDTDQRFVSVTREIQREKHPALVMVLLQGIDRASHFLWAGIEDPNRYPPATRWSPEKINTARIAVQSYYEFTDALIGVLLEDVGPEDLVIVMSDHGFEAPKPNSKVGTGSHHSDAARDGIFFARGRDIQKGSETTGLTIDDVAPTVLAWMGIPVGEDMDGKPAAFLETPLETPIATHDTTEILRLDGESGSDEAILKQLKALGYIE